MNQNKILSDYQTVFGAYPFDQIKTEDYREAFEQAIEKKRQEINKIITCPDEPSFSNTILALEECGKDLETVCGIFFNLLHADSNDELMAISQEVMPKLSELSTSIILSDELFQRIKHVYDQRGGLNLDEEDARILQNCYEGFAESGALLDKEGKKRLEELSLSLSKHSLDYGQNMLKDQKRFRLYIDKEEDVVDMPETILNQAKKLAEQEGKESGWLFDLSAPSYMPFMQYCPNRSLREKMYLAKMSVANANNEFDNKEHIRALVNGRLEEAKLLGYPSFAHYALHKRMAKDPERVYELLDELLSAYKETGFKEIEEIRSFASKHDFSEDMQAWDWSYWAERYMKENYNLDAEMLRSYFELNKVIDAVFSLATTLYDIQFKLREDIPVYHKDVKVFEVLDENQEYIALLYTDFFPRSGKQSGAWMNNLQDQYHTRDGKDHRPHIVLVMNFTPPNKDGISLLTAGEVNTFLHEFGHALHGIFSKCRYSSISGTGVARDFVELPSQIMENWLGQEEWLKSFAFHYETGEALPQEFIDRMKRAKHFLSAYSCCRQLSFGYLDMAWHSLNEPLADDVDLKIFENQAWEQALLLPQSPEGTMMSTSFGHIFSGGYSAGYYGYKWAEVLDADAFSVFKKEGIFNKEVAQRFRKEILEQGDKRDADVLYRAFRGQDPSIEALLRRDGIIKEETQVS